MDPFHLKGNSRAGVHVTNTPFLVKANRCMSWSLSPRWQMQLCNNWSDASEELNPPPTSLKQQILILSYFSSTVGWWERETALFDILGFLFRVLGQLLVCHVLFKRLSNVPLELSHNNNFDVNMQTKNTPNYLSNPSVTNFNTFMFLVAIPSWLQQNLTIN